MSKAIIAVAGKGGVGKTSLSDVLLKGIRIKRFWLLTPTRLWDFPRHSELM